MYAYSDGLTYDQILVFVLITSSSVFKSELRGKSPLLKQLPRKWSFYWKDPGSVLISVSVSSGVTLRSIDLPHASLLPYSCSHFQPDVVTVFSLFSNFSTTSVPPSFIFKWLCLFPPRYSCLFAVSSPPPTRSSWSHSAFTRIWLVCRDCIHSPR